MFGIFDSGVGGLSIFRLLERKFPEAGFLYLGDTAHFPYGNKSRAAIRDYALKNTEFLLKRGAKVIIIACHTASSLAADYLRRKFKNVPIYDVITPTVQEVLELDIKRIGIIGTRATVESKIYDKKILKTKKILIVSQACPLLVSLIEEGWLDRPEMLSVLKYYLLPLKRQKIESLILSCTHYSLIRKEIQDVIGKDIKLIDPAKVLVKYLEKDGIQISRHERTYREFWVTDFPRRFQELSKIFLGKEVKVKKIPETAMRIDH